MLQFRDVLAAFPHLLTRIDHCLCLFSDENLKFFNRRTLLLAILPLFVDALDVAFTPIRPGNEEDDLEHVSPTILHEVRNCIHCLWLLNKAHNAIIAVEGIISTPTLAGKLQTALDMWLEANFIGFLEMPIYLLVHQAVIEVINWRVGHNFAPRRFR